MPESQNQQKAPDCLGGKLKTSEFEDVDRQGRFFLHRQCANRNQIDRTARDEIQHIAWAMRKQKRRQALHNGDYRRELTSILVLLKQLLHPPNQAPGRGRLHQPQ